MHAHCARFAVPFAKLLEPGSNDQRIGPMPPERLYEAGAKQGSVAKEFGITGTQLKTWRLEIEAFGSAEAKRRQKADAAPDA